MSEEMKTNEPRTPPPPPSREMREEEEEGRRFARWEEELPSPEELMPLSQSLITPDLALAFDIIPTGGVSGGAEEPARTLKRPRLVWTPQLHKRFVDAVAHLGMKNAVPKTIMQLMSVDGLTRENVASHLQKYRLYLNRMQMQGRFNSGPVSAADQLFAAAAPEHLLPYHMPAMQQQQQYYHQRRQQLGHFASPTVVAAAAAAVGLFDHGFFARQQPGMHRMASYPDDFDSRAAGGGSAPRVLTLFPTGDD